MRVVFGFNKVGSQVAYSNGLFLVQSARENTTSSTAVAGVDPNNMCTIPELMFTTRVLLIKAADRWAMKDILLSIRKIRLYRLERAYYEVH